MNIHETQPGDLVYIIDPDGAEPIKMGVGLVVGETKIYPEYARSPSTPVLWDGRVEYLDKPYWILQVISR